MRSFWIDVSVNNLIAPKYLQLDLSRLFRRDGIWLGPLCLLNMNIYVLALERGIKNGFAPS